MLYVPFVFGPSFVCQQIRCQPDGIRAGCCQERSSSVRRRSSFIGGQTEENNAKELIPGLSHFSWIFKEDTRVCWQNKRGKLLPGSSQDKSTTSRKISSPRCLARCRTRLDGLRKFFPTIRKSQLPKSDISKNLVTKICLSRFDGLRICLWSGPFP